MSSLPILPLDLIAQILSRLPVKFLIRFTCVSKQWKSLIFDPPFAKLHLQQSPKNTHVLLTLLDDIDEDSVWVLIPSPVRHLLEHPSDIDNEDGYLMFHEDTYYTRFSSTNGLVCLVCLMGVEPLENGIRELFVKFWNPCLRLRSKKSPRLTIRLRERTHVGFGYDDSSDTYKVVAVFWDHTTQKMEGRVHCMGDNCWRKTLACPTFPILLRRTLNGSFVNGNVNWLALHNSDCHHYRWENVTIKQLVIFSLDLRKETCKYMLLPDGFGEVPQNEPTLTVLRGRLCLYYDHMGTHFVLWEMREFGVQESWTQLVNVSYVHLQFEDIVPDWLQLPVCLSENGDVLLLASKEIGICDDVIMYNRRDGRVECIGLPNSQIWAAVEHMQSLVLPRPRPH